MEGNIIKRALGLTKYHSIFMIINALEIQPKDQKNDVHASTVPQHANLQDIGATTE